MKKNIQVFIITLKKSSRTKLIKERLKYLKIKYKIFYGVDGLNFKNKNILLNEYNKYNYINREMALPEIAAALSHLNLYKKIVRDKIQTAIILEDDTYPSIAIKEWIKRNIKTQKNNIVSFNAYPSGFLKKSSNFNVINESINIHKAITHINSGSCYQINYYLCKKIIKLTGGKVGGASDWPINLLKNNINLFVTIPYLAIVDNKFLQSTFLKRQKYSHAHLSNLEKYIKARLPKELINKNKIFNFFSIFYYLSFLPFIIRKYKNFDYYLEYYFYKSLVLLQKVFFLKKVINTENIFFDKNFYYKDLADHRFFKKD
jgi:glycosyl transferase family 25